MLQTTGASAPFDANTQTETNSQTSQKPFPEKIKFLDALLHIQDNFDIIKREYTVGTHSIVIYYVAGLIVDQTLERIAGALLEMPATDEDFSDANRFSQKMITYGEVNITSDESKMLELLYTGCVVLVCDAFEPFVILTVRGYPQRNPEEPENDKVLRGPHISFVETLAKIQHCYGGIFMIHGLSSSPLPWETSRKQKLRYAICMALPIRSLSKH